MTRSAHPAVRVRLARSLPRLLAAPVLLVAMGAVSIGAGVLLVGSVPGLALATLGALLAVTGALLGVALLNVRVHVEESLVRVQWPLGRRVYLLTPGPLTRVHLRGDGASTIRPRVGLGWAVGGAILRGEEEIDVVRLAPTESVILIPTARGRLAIATSNEPHLIDTLMRAARAREIRADLLVPEPLEPVPPAPQAVPEVDAELLTGIERARYEQSTHTAESAGAASDAPAAIPISRAAASGHTAPARGLEQRRRAFRPPSWARRASGLPNLRSVPIPSISVPRVPQRVRDIPVGRPRPSWLIPLIPLVGAGAAWAVGLTIGEMPPDGSDSGRLASLGLVLAGPATAIGAIMARAWWPQISGVVVTGGLIASIFIARALWVG